MIAAFASHFVAPASGWYATLVILLAAALLVIWSIVWRLHLGRKWSLEQGRAG
jgi:hypothetical protein